MHVIIHSCRSKPKAWVYSAEHKRRYFEGYFSPYNESQWGPKQHRTSGIFFCMDKNETKISSFCVPQRKKNSVANLATLSLDQTLENFLLLLTFSLNDILHVNTAKITAQPLSLSYAYGGFVRKHLDYKSVDIHPNAWQQK